MFYLSNTPEETFNLGSIDQPLGNDLQIYTEKDWPLMYVLDRQNKRLVVVNKENGGVIKQYLNNDLANVKQIVVDDGQKNIFRQRQQTTAERCFR